MAARSSLKGFLKLSLVSVPVKAYTATASGGEARLEANPGVFEQKPQEMTALSGFSGSSPEDLAVWTPTANLGPDDATRANVGERVGENRDVNSHEAGVGLGFEKG